MELKDVILHAHGQLLLPKSERTSRGRGEPSNQGATHFLEEKHLGPWSEPMGDDVHGTRRGQRGQA